MAKLVLRDCVVKITTDPDGTPATTDFSDHVSSVEVTLSKDEIDTTNFGGDGRERTHGLKDDSFVLNFQQDFAASSVDAVLFPLYDTEVEFDVTVQPTAGAISATNPGYTGRCILLEYQPLSGEVGALSETSVTFPSQRDGITRSVTP